MRELTLDCGGVRLNVADFGGEGPPLVLFHGVVRRWQDWSELIPEWAKTHRVMGVDQRGHGRSDRASGRYGVTDYVRDAAELLRRHVPGRAVVVGHSLGAMVAAGAAAMAPEKVAGVVMEDPPFDTLASDIRRTPFHAQFCGMRSAVEGCGGSVERLAAALAEVRMPTVDMAGQVRLGDVRSAEVLRVMAESMVLMDRSVLDPLIEGCWLDGYDVEATVAGIRCPALLLQGEYRMGGMLPDPRAREVASKIPECRHVKIEGVGHHLHALAATRMLDAVRQFLA